MVQNSNEMQSNMTDYSKLIKTLLPFTKKAGDEIMEVYDNDFDHELKSDGSPVTKADKAAEKILLNGLKRYAPGITVISEENPSSHVLKAPDIFFLVDALDGTREFLKRDGKGAFTVNIALIENNKPTLGIVYAPALKRMFYGATKLGAFENESEIQVLKVSKTNPVAVASESHRDIQTDQWLSDHKIKDTISIGSSLKFCLLACGEADIYPRFSPTMEWDTAAGDAILRAAGGMVSNLDGTPFQYGKDEYRNGAFIARGNGWGRK